MNRIGLLTYHHTTNFGSLLQTYALFKKVSELGYDCQVIDYRNDAVERREAPKKLKECRGLRQIRDYLKYEPKKREKAAAFKMFAEQHMSISDKRYDIHSVYQTNNLYDTFLVGSDLVWDFSINNHDLTYMLDFANENSKKIAYASSVGKLWDSCDISHVSQCLNSFDHIGVRESEIKTALTGMIATPVDFVGDPTILVRPEEWANMAAPRIIDEDYVLVYFSDKDMKIYEDAVQYGKEKKLPVYLISYSWVPNDLKAIRPTTVDEFLSLIRYADTVFTASYHGMLFSLYFEKNFYYYNRGWKARMRSIAEYLHIESREQLNSDACELDYCDIIPKMNELRYSSEQHLKSWLQE